MSPNAGLSVSFDDLSACVMSAELFGLCAYGIVAEFLSMSVCVMSAVFRPDGLSAAACALMPAAFVPFRCFTVGLVRVL